MKTLIIGTTLATLLAAPAFAQSYTASAGTGNTINLPLAEQTNGAQGVGVGMYSPVPQQQTSPYAYAPRRHAARVESDAASRYGAYAYVPAPSYGAYSDSPAATGGGSVGYNDKLLHD